jgi:translation initiation factor 2D
LKDIKGGDTLIWAVSAEHPDLEGFAGHQVVTAVEPTNSNAENTAKKLVYTKYYRLRSCPLILDPDAFCDEKQVKNQLLQYVKKANLADPNDRRLVVLDDTLLNVVGSAPMKLNREQLLAKFLAKCEPFFALHKEDELASCAPMKGHMTPITISEAIRQGRKKVTVIDGLDDYPINIEGLSEQLRKRYATNVSEQLVSVTKTRQQMQLTAQGAHAKSIGQWLQSSFGVPVELIVVNPKGK